MTSYAIEQIAKENPLCRIFYNKHIFIYGESTFQLEQIVNRLRGHYHLDIQSDEPKIIYYRTIKTPLKREYIQREKKKFAHIALKLEPQEQGEKVIHLKMKPKGVLSPKSLSTLSI